MRWYKIKLEGKLEGIDRKKLINLLLKSDSQIIFAKTKHSADEL